MVITLLPPLPRQALEGLYAVVNPHIRIFSRQWAQKGSDMIILFSFAKSIFWIKISRSEKKKYALLLR